jgi:archaemetzincin
MPPRTKTKVCTHQNLIFTPSPHAHEAGYKQPTLAQREAAANPQGSPPSLFKSGRQDFGPKESTFPAPLVLPDDELSRDPKYPVQSMKDWLMGGYRNAVTKRRKTIYVLPPPGCGVGSESVRGWTVPRLGKDGKRAKGEKDQREGWTEKATEDVLGYLRAFYWGMEVKMLDVGEGLKFMRDGEGEEEKEKEKGKSRKGGPKKEDSPTLWLNTHKPDDLIGICTRATPKGAFSHQLNLTDLLEFAIEILPQDAYALLMLMEHDMFEDQEDEFVCGRAYGGSRVAVITTARYDPALDAMQGVERVHAWPASHCQDYIQRCIEEAKEEEEDGEAQPKKKRQKMTTVEGEKQGDRVSPMQAAVRAHSSLPPLDLSPSSAALSGLWLGRVCRTVSHELGHCFGIDHCVSYACCMQGSASIIEDARQPPYLCPVDLAKVLRATEADDKILDRYRALEKFCKRFSEVHLFEAFGKWIEGRMVEFAASEVERT